jgi:Fic family protein
LVEEANNKYCYPSLSLSEIEEVCKSAINYTLQDKNLVKNPLNWGYEPTKTKDEIMATRLEHIENVNKNRVLQSHNKIKTVLDDIFLQDDIKFKNGKYKASAIAKIAKIDKRTVAKYLKEMNLIEIK